MLNAGEKRVDSVNVQCSEVDRQLKQGPEIIGYLPRGKRVLATNGMLSLRTLPLEGRLFDTEEDSHDDGTLGSLAMYY